MRKWLCLALMVVCNPSVSLADPTVGDFAYGIKIDVPAGSAVAAASLPEQVYKNAFRRDLGDVRVFNAEGEPVPHLIRYAQTQSAEAPWRSLVFFPLPQEATWRCTSTSGRVARSAPATGDRWIDIRPGRSWG